MEIRRRPPNPSVSVSSMSYKIAHPDEKPRHILEEIVWQKEVEVAQRRERIPLVELQKQVATAPPVRDFLQALRHSRTQPAVIAEVKKASPSKGVFRDDFDPVAIARAYQEGGAACISVLTDEKFFQGSFDNLTLVRQTVEIPLICKDFLIYPYQIYQARVSGADAVLLIASILSDKDLQYFIKIVKTLGMTALVEVHTLEELDRVLGLEGVALIGINNRNLENFSVSLETTQQLLNQRRQVIAERDILIVSESGLHTASDLAFVVQAGASAVLIGESLVKQPDPGVALTHLIGPN